MRSFNLKTAAMPMDGRLIAIADVNNIGLDNKIDLVETYDSVYAKNVKSSYADIVFKLIIMGGNVENPYLLYNSYAERIAENAINVLEYSDGLQTLYRDTIVKRFSKTQKNEFNVLDCELVLTPVSMWYTKTESNLTLNIAHEIRGNGKQCPLTITIKSYSLTNPNIKLLKSGVTIQEIAFSDITLSTGNINVKDHLVIDGTNKKITYNDVDNSLWGINAYDNTDKTKNSFIIIPSDFSIYNLLVTSATGSQSEVIIELNYRSYVF